MRKGNRKSPAKVMFSIAQCLEEFFAIGCCDCSEKCAQADRDDCKVRYIVELKEQMTTLGLLDKERRCDRCKRPLSGTMFFSQDDKDFCSVGCLTVYISKRGQFNESYARRKHPVSAEPDLLAEDDGSTPGDGEDPGGGRIN